MSRNRKFRLLEEEFHWLTVFFFFLKFYCCDEDDDEDYYGIWRMSVVVDYYWKQTLDGLDYRH